MIGAKADGSKAGGKLGSALAAVRAKPSRIVMGVAGVAIVANAMALAAPESPETKSDYGRMGVSLQEATRQRDRVMAAERRKLEMREEAVKASEARLAQQMKQSEDTAAENAVATDQNAPVPDVPYDNLARIYQTMKPQRAGPIFEKLELHVQTQVAKRMRERSVAQIMTYMSKEAAVELSMSLAGRDVIQTSAARPSDLRLPDTRGGRTAPNAAKPLG